MTWKLSKIWFVSAQNLEDARKVLGFEVHTLLIDEWAEVEPEIWRFMSGSVRSPISTDIAGRPTSAQILGGTTPGGMGAEALKCLFGCDGPKKQAPGADESTYRPEQYRAIKSSIDQNPTYAVGTPAGDGYRAGLKDLPPALQAKWMRDSSPACGDCNKTLVEHRNLAARLRNLGSCGSPPQTREQATKSYSSQPDSVVTM